MPAEPLSPTVGGNSGSGLSGLQPYTPVVLTDSAINSAAPTSASTFKMTDGWYLAIACTFGIVTADTRIGPVSFGILGLALIYQLTLLVQHK